jgi:sulfopyruvate decarboxylase TPP-binding subunit
VALTTEEEGVALAAGADLGGARAVLLMQSSGVGNCINMLSLTSGGRFPFLTLISMRGDFGEGNPVAVSHGQGDPARARGHGRDLPARESPQEALAAVNAAITMVFQAGRSSPCCSPRSCSAPRSSEEREMAAHSTGKTWRARWRRPSCSTASTPSPSWSAGTRTS